MVGRNAEREARPVPLVDPARCDGCGLCVLACPGGALAMRAARVIVARPEACTYAGLCERICPRGAIRLPVEIVSSDQKMP